MELHIRNFASYLTGVYANYIDTVHIFVPAQYKFSLEGEFGGVSKKYARILIDINKRNAIESYYRNARKSINLDLVKKQIAYGFVLFKNTELLDPEQFNNYIYNITSAYTTPMHRVENLFRKCKFSTHKNSRIGDEFSPINYSEYCSRLANNQQDQTMQNMIDSAYLKYITQWPDGNIEYVHSFIALEDFVEEGIEAGDIIGVKDYEKANKEKIVGNVIRPSTYFSVDWRTI